jgi:glycosyltransferase involved in cell wall biosynthesis
MHVTIAICTRNRADSLHRTLDSITLLQIPKQTSWELIVVDNGSTDTTSDVIAHFAERLPMRHLFEPRRGASNARNTAVAASSGEYMLWTDDDVIVDREWLSAYMEAFQQRPEAAFFGGKILPQLEDPVPTWVTECWSIIANVFSRRDFGDLQVPLTLDPRRLPFGANWAVRRVELQAHPYDPNLGVGSQVGTGEETEVIESMLREGKQGYWVPGAKVVHWISSQRQTLPYVIEHFKTYGRSLAYRDHVCGVPQFLGAPRWLWRRMVLRGCVYRYHRFTSSSPIWMEHLFGYATDKGALEYYRQRRPGYRARVQAPSSACSRSEGGSANQG